MSDLALFTAAMTTLNTVLQSVQLELANMRTEREKSNALAIQELPRLFGVKKITLGPSESTVIPIDGAGIDTVSILVSSTEQGYDGPVVFFGLAGGDTVNEIPGNYLTRIAFIGFPRTPSMQSLSLQNRNASQSVNVYVYTYNGRANVLRF